MTEVLNGSARNTVGVTVMAKIPNEEKVARHERMVAFLDSSAAVGRTVAEIADAVGCSRSAVYNEFVRRRVPMLQGQKATYQLPAPVRRPRGTRKARPISDVRDPATRTPQEKIEDYLRTGGQGGTVAEISRATGLPFTVVQDTFAAMGLAGGIPVSEPAPVTRAAALAEVGASLATATAGERPEGKVAYLAQISDGRHVGIDLLTGIPWVLEPVHPL